MTCLTATYTQARLRVMALKDLEQIQHDIDNKHIRPLIAEVIKCYEAGAYRAAIVSLWTAVVTDLTGKIRTLAEAGDGEAKSIIENLDRALNNQTVAKVQEYERNILKTASKSLQILLPREIVELERLNEDRNLCAHPGFINENDLFIPDAEAVRAHLVTASRAVFSQRPLAGKRLLSMLEQEMNRESWPNEGDYFLERFFHQARKSAKRNMIILLIKQSIRPPEGNKQIARRALGSALSIIKEAPLEFENNLSSILEAWEESGILEDPQLIRASGAYGGTPTFWRALPKTAKSRLLKLLDHCKSETLVNEGFFVCETMVNNEVNKIRNIALSELTTEQLDIALEDTISHDMFIPTIIDHVKRSSTFRTAENNLSRLEQYSESLSADDVASLRKAIQENKWNQVRRAGRSEAILCSIFNGNATNKETRTEWRTLAEWLHSEGKHDEDDDYLYNDFLELVTDS